MKMILQIAIVFWILEKGILELLLMIGENHHPTEMEEKREKEEVGEVLELVPLVVVGMPLPQVVLVLDRLKVMQHFLFSKIQN